MHVRLFFRKQRQAWHVSIEHSFQQVMRHFPENSLFYMDSYTSSYFSNGFLPRLKAILEVKKNQADINHITGDTHFFNLALPKEKTVLTIHDCYFMQHNNPIMRYLLKLFWLKLPVKNAQIVTAVSEATKRDIIHFTGCNPDKIRVIPTVIRSNFSYSPKIFNEKRPTILHIGTAANKNLARHAEALAGINCHFHIIGDMSEMDIKTVEKWHLDYKNSVNLSEKEIQKAYEQADILLFCSTTEGFGMPILEAQTVGRVVVTSNSSSMPEVAGEGACLADPLSIESIRKAILIIINDEKYRNKLIVKGLDNIQRFDPKVVAKQYESVYAALVNKKIPYLLQKNHYIT